MTSTTVSMHRMFPQGAETKIACSSDSPCARSDFIAFRGWRMRPPPPSWLRRTRWGSWVKSGMSWKAFQYVSDVSALQLDVSALWQKRNVFLREQVLRRMLTPCSEVGSSMMKGSAELR